MDVYTHRASAAELAWLITLGVAACLVVGAGLVRCQEALSHDANCAFAAAPVSRGRLAIGGG